MDTTKALWIATPLRLKMERGKTKVKSKWWARNQLIAIAMAIGTASRMPLNTTGHWCSLQLAEQRVVIGRKDPGLRARIMATVNGLNGA